jgi:lipopolysaccharide/colanic/teichoic acid biosynthesis glycosyltransferase/GT2 family glycosyltransferase
MPQSQPCASTPVCSIVVAVHNGAATITRCLQGLAQQTVPIASCEVLVVAAASADGTQALVAQWAACHPDVPLSLLALPTPSLSAARNCGVQSARAPIVLFAEADCVPAPNWVEAMAAAFADPSVIGARGTFRTEQGGIVPRLVQEEYEDRYDRMRRRDTIDFIDNYSAAYRRDVFLANGGFDVEFGACEDQELSFRLAAKGYRLVFAPEAVVTHLHDTSLRDYMRRKYAQGFWKAPLTHLHPDRMVEDTHTPQVLKLQIVLVGLMLALLPLLLLAPLLPSAAGGPPWLALELLLLAEIALGAIFLLSALPFLAKLARRSPTLAAFGPPVLAARALSLGSGYLAGTIHFAGTLPGARRPVIPGWKRVIKRGLDIVGALVGLALAIPLVAIAAIAIKLDTRGPVFFGQVRIGENGRRFRIFKLRSMVSDAERRLDALVDLGQLAVEPAFKIPDDPRVTRVGRFLRRTSLDELPQFLNVLRGEMSLVGPRPEEERIVALYTDYHRRRLAVKPGLTGPMQVSGRGDLPFSQRLELELDYIDHYSLRRDFSILLRTLPVLLQGKGAH